MPRIGSFGASIAGNGTDTEPPRAPGGPLQRHDQPVLEDRIQWKVEGKDEAMTSLVNGDAIR